MTASPAGPERRYRRLLWAYPSAYRRRHGAEIVTTLLEMAESGHGRPTRGQTLHLVACGVRQRFRLPAGRPLVVVAAVLAAIALGGLGTAGGTWLGWRLATPVPSSNAMRALTVALAGSQPDIRVDRLKTAMNGPWMASTTTGPAPFSAERVRTGLTSAGWRITTFNDATGAYLLLNGEPRGQISLRGIQYTATKDGLSLTGSSYTVVGDTKQGTDGELYQHLDVWTADAAAVRPLTIVGLLFGLLAGWLLTAALANRVRQSRRAHRNAVAVLAMTAFAAAVVPAYGFYRNLYQVLSYHTDAPNPYIVYGPREPLPGSLVLACTAIGLLALTAMVLIAARGPRTGPDPTRQEPVASN